MLKAALLAQAIGALTPVPEFKFDLGGLLGANDCGAGDGEEIVVCGKQDDRRFRLPRIDESLEAAGLPRAETRIGSFRGSIDTEAVTLGGAQSNRLMLRLTTPF